MSLGKLIILIGIIFIIVGIIISLFEKLPFNLGKLPGDIIIKKNSVTIHMPIISSLIISILLTILLNLILFFITKFK